MTGPTTGPATGGGEGIVEPVGAPLRRRLRAAVLEHVTTESRRVHPPLLHVGGPGSPGLVFPALDGRALPDVGLCTDAVAALLRRAGAGDPLLWLTRTGDLDPQDVDLRWLAAARAAAAEAGLPLTMVVVTRRGWRDPRSGAERTWVRLRRR